MTLTPATPAVNVCCMAFDAIRDHAKYLPRDAFAVGGYINGANHTYIWTPTEWGLFPNSYHIQINVTGDPNVGNALDIENGDATIADVVPWINTRGPIAKGPLMLYCDRTNLPAVMAERGKANFPAYMWVATLDGTIEPDRAMTQFAQVAFGNSGIVSDVSAITNSTIRARMAAAQG